MISLDSPAGQACQVVQDLPAENTNLEKVVHFQDRTIQSKERIIRLQNEKIHLLNLLLWDPKGERLSPVQTALLFDEASVTAAEPQQEAKRPPAEKENPAPKSGQASPNHSGREKLAEQLERREVVVPAIPKSGAERPVIGYETHEERVCEPISFYVNAARHHRTYFGGIQPGARVGSQ
jgi:hypothetical protein